MEWNGAERGLPGFWGGSASAEREMEADQTERYVRERIMYAKKTETPSLMGPHPLEPILQEGT
jgi:hypothetical protein